MGGWYGTLWDTGGVGAASLSCWGLVWGIMGYRGCRGWQLPVSWRLQALGWGGPCQLSSPPQPLTRAWACVCAVTALQAPTAP